MASLDPRAVAARVTEFARVRGDPGSELAALVEAALFVEDVFGLRLSDADVCESKLGTLDRIERLVLERLGLI